MQITRRNYPRNSAWHTLSAQEVLPISMKSLYLVPYFLYYLNGNFLYRRMYTLSYLNFMRDSAFSVCRVPEMPRHIRPSPIFKKFAIWFQQSILSYGLIFRKYLSGELNLLLAFYQLGLSRLKVTESNSNCIGQWT